MIKYAVYVLVILTGAGFISSEQYAAPLRKNNSIQQKEKKFKGKCWSKNDQDTLLGRMETVIQTPLEIGYRNDDYIQTFGCAYPAHRTQVCCR